MYVIRAGNQKARSIVTIVSVPGKQIKNKFFQKVFGPGEKGHTGAGRKGPNPAD